MKNEPAFWQRCLERGEQLLAPQPRSHTEAYRHELKYLISWVDKAELTTRMSPVLKLDPHATNGGYFIRSLYFDDYWNTAYEEKDARSEERRVGKECRIGCRSRWSPYH